MKLLAIPFVPNQYEFLYLCNHNVLADQMGFLALSFQQIFHSHKGFDKHNNTIPGHRGCYAQICYDSRSRYFRKLIMKSQQNHSLGFLLSLITAFMWASYLSL